MRIAQISTLSAPVAEKSFGSVEAFVWLLTRELMHRGHDVTVFGTADSVTEGKLVATLPGPYGQAGSPGDWQLCEWLNLCAAVGQSAQFDLLHSHAYLWGLPLARLARAPMVHTTHIVPDDDAISLRTRFPEARVTGVSQQQWAGSSHPPAVVIEHGVDISQFTYSATPGDYVCYLGRFTAGKGPRHAIAAARALGVRIVLAGAPNPYFREQIQPLVDGKDVEFIGRVEGKDRDQLLGGARALLYPIQYPESFGLVVVEAMLCGTPVAALRHGAVADIVTDGVTGAVVDSLPQFADAVRKCLSLDRARIRREASERFSAQRMVEEYIQFYQRVASSWPAPLSP